MAPYTFPFNMRLHLLYTSYYNLLRTTQPTNYHNSIIIPIHYITTL